MLIALTRHVAPSIADCELTYLPRVGIDYRLAVEQHGQYEAALADLGCRVVSLPPEPNLPDSVFVEDVAVVLDEVAVLTRPGAESRRPEIAAVAAALGEYRPLEQIKPPGTLEGGDVLQVGRAIYIGLSSRTNRPGIEQFQAVTKRFGYTVHPVPVEGCLHLKSAVTRVAPDTLLVNPRWVRGPTLDEIELVEVAAGEPYAANALLVNGSLIYPTSFPRTRAALEKRGLRVVPVDVSELQKAEGAVTCCSLVFDQIQLPE